MRITRDQMFMDIAHTVAKRSTCFRLNVGAVIVVDGRIVSIGYNGAPPGHAHCSGNSCPGSTPGKCPTIHAEDNALRYWDPQRPGATLYVTDAPCFDCATLIANSLRISRVVFARPYRDRSGIDILMSWGIHVDQITPAGYVINQATRSILTPEA